jgi:hypothetical protein
VGTNSSLIVKEGLMLSHPKLGKTRSYDGEQGRLAMPCLLNPVRKLMVAMFG